MGRRNNIRRTEQPTGARWARLEEEMRDRWRDPRPERPPANGRGAQPRPAPRQDRAGTR